MWYLVRHPETVWNAERRYQGWQDVPWSATGQAQAEGLLSLLSRIDDYDLVLTSDLGRCYRLAAAIARQRQVPLQSSSDLRELHFGQWEGLTFDEVTEFYPDNQAAWLEDVEAVAPLGGETFRQFTQRLQRVLTPYLSHSLCLVTHGGVVAWVLQRWGKGKFWLPGNGACAQLDLATGEVSWLEPDQRTMPSTSD